MLYNLMLGILLSALSTWLTALATTLGVLTAVVITVIPFYGFNSLFKRRK